MSAKRSGEAARPVMGRPPIDEERPTLRQKTFMATPEVLEAIALYEAEIPEDVNGRKSIAIRQAILDGAATKRRGAI